MTALSKAALVGATALLRYNDGLSFPVTILDVKESYGALRFQVAPVGGIGETWVDASRVTVAR